MSFSSDRRTLLKRRPHLAKWLKSDSKSSLEVNGSPLDPLNLDLLNDLKKRTPSQIGVGRSGTRYPTNLSLMMRANHAVAKDAVYSEISDSFLSSLSAINLHSRCENREDYLLYPDKGRRLDADSLQRLNELGTKNVDVTIIIGDGLSAWAAERNVLELISHLELELKNAAFSFGKLLFVRFARVGVQDHIGVELKSKATVILLGERPGLGTGDSLSAYIAYNPKLNQDNAEKNCISNIRQLGILPSEGAKEIVKILKRSFETGKGGIASL